MSKSSKEHIEVVTENGASWEAPIEGDTVMTPSEFVGEQSVSLVDESKKRRVHCEACSKNYDLGSGESPVCCEKPNISEI